MKFTIFKNWHFAFPPAIGIYSKTKFSWAIQFDRTAKYDIGSDQIAVNKLIGIAFFSGIHKDSARFGWRYNKYFNTMKIEIFSYVYNAGIRTQKLIAVVNPDTEYIYSLNVYTDKYEFVISSKGEVVGQTYVPKFHTRKWCRKCGLYFGGVRTAPHDITVKIKKISV